MRGTHVSNQGPRRSNEPTAMPHPRGDFNFRPVPELQVAALEVITRAQAGDPFAQVTLIVPSRSQGWILRRQLASRLEPGSALVNVRN